MKYLNHEFKNKNGKLLPKDNCRMYDSDTCIFCNKQVHELASVLDAILTLKDIRESETFMKCLTEEEFAIKNLLE